MDIITVSGRECYLHATDEPEFMLIQPVDEHEITLLRSELAYIKANSACSFAYAGFRISNWNRELSPWQAPPVFGSEPFGDGAAETLAFVKDELLCQLRNSRFGSIPTIIGGYSLAGLFALWTAYSTDAFAAAACVSPSVWFPNWIDFAETRKPAADIIYLSLGSKEEKARNKVMAAVGDNIRRQHELLKPQTSACTLEMNEGNHFKEPDLRTAKGFAWCMEQLSERRRS